MPTIYFAKGLNPVKAEKGLDLMKALRAADIPVGSSCGGEGVCTKCLIKITKGEENLSSENEREIELRKQHSFDTNLRVSCQAKVLGDIEVDTDYW